MVALVCKAKISHLWDCRAEEVFVPACLKACKMTWI